MKKILLIAIFWTTQSKVSGQIKFEWNYFFGSDTTEVVRKLKNYISFYNYRGMLYKTDSTLELEVTKDSASWRIFSVFYFNHQGKCYSFSNTRCDKYGLIHFNDLLADKEYKWKKVDESTYVSRFSKSEMLNYISDDSCFLYRMTKLKLSRKQFSALRSSNK